jgi:hypothetical protein
MKNLITLLLIALFFGNTANGQCPPGAFAYQSTYAQCATGCGVLLLGWPEGVQVNIYGGTPLTIITSAIVTGTYGGPGTGDAFTCVPCNTPLVYAASAPGASSGCVIATIGIVPVKFISFSANTIANQTQFTWKVATETAPVKYIIQQSTDGRNFTDGPQINSSANAGGQYQHQQAVSGTANFYRIKAVEISGETIYSATVWVKKANDKAITVYPNPSQNEFNLSVPAQHLPAQLMVFNAQGVMMMQKSITATATSFYNHLPKGLYTLKIASANRSVSTHRLIKN